MTATTSSETAKKSRMNSFFGRRYITGINSNKKGLIVNCIMQLLALPVAAVIALLLCYLEENYDKLGSDTISSIENGTMAFAVIAVIAFGVSIMSGIPTAMAHFSYLHKKAQADMHYALPLNNRQRFIADYLSGLTVYLGPVIAAVILAFAILGIGSAFINTEPVWKQLMPIAIKIGVVVFMAMLQLYTVAVFSLTFCGNGFEAGFSICAFNVLIPATILCLWSAVTETATFGVVAESILKMNIFTDTSPVGAAAFLMNLDDYFSFAYDSVSTFNSLFAKWLILNVLCTAAYAVAAFFLYKSRKAEDVSKPYVHRSFFYALLTMAVFCVLSLFIIGEAPISAGIVICAVGWFVMEIITRRGFKRFWTAAVGFVAATAAVFGIIGICTVSDGFGASKRIPTADSVKSVTINCGDSYLITSCEFTDEKVIEEAVKLHQQCIDQYYSFDEKNFPPVDLNDNIVHVDDDLFRVSYTMKSGAGYTREYTVSQSMEADLMKAILLSDEAADVCSEDVGYIDVHSNAQNPCGVNAEYLGVSTSVNISEKELEELRGDLKADMLDMTEEELVNVDVYCYLDNGMFVLDSFERTIADLNDFGLDLSGVTIEDEFTIMPDPVFASYTILSYGSRTDVHDYEYTYYMDYDALSEVDQLCNLSSYSYGDMCSGTAYEISCENPYIDQLLDNMTTFIIGQKPIAAIDLYGNNYYLKDTDENRKLIEKLMEYKIDEYDCSHKYEYEYSDDEIYDEIYY
ncbi:MAG: hypothetical protein NC093_08215 [Alistipes sp.]|nr:hypothetical protein [Alistipes sp.]